MCQFLSFQPGDVVARSEWLGVDLGAEPQYAGCEGFLTGNRAEPMSGECFGRAPRAPPRGVAILASDTQNSPQLGAVGTPSKRAATHCMAWGSPSTNAVNRWLVPVLSRNGGSSLVWNWTSAPRAHQSRPS